MRSDVFRRATPADAPALADLFLAARREAMPWLPEQHSRDATVAFLGLLPARAEVWIADAATGPAGFIAFGGGEVAHLYVAPARQREGVGAALLALAQARAEPLELWVFARNAPARAFYEGRGFRLVRESDGGENEERQPAARYRWEPT